MPVSNDQLAEIQRRVESVPGTALAQELKNNAEALLQQPENPALHFGVGLLYARVGDFGSSAKMLNIALNLAGNNEIILGALAYLYANHVGDHELALGYLKKKHKLNKKDVSTLLLMAFSELNLGRHEDAEATLQKVEKLDASHPQLAYMRAQIAIQSGNLEKAREELANLSDKQFNGRDQMIKLLEAQIETAQSSA